MMKLDRRNLISIVGLLFFVFIAVGSVDTNTQTGKRRESEVENKEAGSKPTDIAKKELIETTATTTGGTTTTTLVSNFIGSWDINGTQTVFFETGGVRVSGGESFTGCIQASENGGVFENGIKTGTWEKTGHTTASIDFYNSLMTRKLESKMKDDAYHNVTFSTVHVSVTLEDDNHISGDLYYSGRYVVYVSSFNLTVRGNFTGVRTTGCASVIK